MRNVADAFENVHRRDFLPDEFKNREHEDRPFPIGYGQTNSQPFTVREMLEWLEVEEGQRVLDVGSGSGWTTALLSYLVGDEGHVYAVEAIPELVEMGLSNCEAAGVRNVSFHEAGQAFGLPGHAPYDRILVSASARDVPHELLEQLTAPGRMVIPVLETIFEVEKDADGHLKHLGHPGYVFVPLIASP